VSSPSYPLLEPNEVQATASTTKEFQESTAGLNSLKDDLVAALNMLKAAESAIDREIAEVERESQHLCFSAAQVVQAVSRRHPVLHTVDISRVRASFAVSNVGITAPHICASLCVISWFFV
jgi:hypothetical protein